MKRSGIKDSKPRLHFIEATLANEALYVLLLLLLVAQRQKYFLALQVE